MDLLIKNFPYFMETYFNVSWCEAAVCWLSTFFICLYWVRRVCNSKSLIWIFLLSMVLTAIIIVSLLNRSRSETRTFILNPYDTLKGILDREVHVLRQTSSNVILYIPLGMVLAMIFIDQDKTVIRLGIFLSVSIEILQYLLCRGYSESMDVVCNTLGCLLGVDSVRAVRRVWKKINNIKSVGEKC